MKAKAKKILIIEGAGFCEQDDIVKLLEGRGDKVVRVRPVRGKVIPEASDADIVLLRGPWTPTPEERAWASVLADELEATFKMLYGRWSQPEGAPLILGIGRGALILLASEVFALCDFAKLPWKPMLLSAGAWIEVKKEQSSFPAGVWGRACPVWGDVLMQKSLEPWLSSYEADSEDVLGLQFESKLRLSFVDILGFGDRAQFPDYGYRELLNIPPQNEILFPLVDGKL